MGRTNTGGSGGIDTSDATATVNDIALDKTAYVNGSKITGTANITTLNLFSQTTQPNTYDGFWVNTSSTVNKIAQVEDFLSKWNTTYGATIPVAVSDFGYCEYGGKIYCIGGVVNSNVVVATLYIYDISNNSWTTGVVMPQAKFGFGCYAYNGKIYCIGGAINTSYTPTNTVYIYDILLGSWSTGTVIPQAKSNFGGGLYNGKIYCIGGYTTNHTNTNYVYDIDNNTWNTGTSIPQVKDSFPSVIVEDNIYCIGGYSTSITNTNYIYNITNNTWSTGAVIPQAKYNFGASEHNGKIYCMGGYNGTTVYNTNHVYDIDTNTWVTDTNMPIINKSFGQITYNDIIFCIGGWNGTFLNINYIYSPNGGLNISLYNSDTLITQNINANNIYNTIIISNTNFIGGFKYYFSDVIINGVNADIYYGDGSQWIKIRSAV